jgi:hypothetical protein
VRIEEFRRTRLGFVAKAGVFVDSRLGKHRIRTHTHADPTW